MKTLRNLSGLIDFESAARLGSFKLAAQELHKTPAAISQQVKQLELMLGFALFTRYPRHLVVTEKGLEFAATVTKVLQELNSKATALQQNDEEAVLRISTTHSFAMKWLVPRLQGFSMLHPELDLRIESNDRAIDFSQSNCDVAVRYIHLRNEGDADILYRERLVVIYSLALLKRKTKPTLAALAKYPLLFEGSPERWLSLLQAERISTRYCDFSRSYSHAGLLVQAAVAAHGVALAPLAIAYEDIEAGRLLAFPHMAIPNEYGYRLLCNERTQRMRKTQVFAQWLRDEIADMERRRYAK